MQVSTKFTIAIHILAATEYFGKDYKVTSDFLAGSIGCNPVIVRNLMKQLRDAGLIAVRRGPGGIQITRPLDQIRTRCSVSMRTPTPSARWGGTSMRPWTTSSGTSRNSSKTTCGSTTWER